MPKSPRQMVLDNLIAILERGEFSHQVIQASTEGYEAQDRKFITRLTRGVVERKLELDDIINQISKTPVKMQKPVIRNVLRMAVYQIRYMDSVPNSAAVNEAVKLVRKRGLQQLSGFVNGVLRGYLRRLEAGEAIEPRSEEAKWNVPQWMLDLWKNAYSKEEYQEILQGINQRPELTAVVNTTKISVQECVERLEAQGIKTALIEKNSAGESSGNSDETIPVNAIRILGSIDLNQLPEFQQGLIYLQDYSSMLPAAYTPVEKLPENPLIIDLCSAPGGKSIDLAIRLNNECNIISRDQSKEKVSKIQENVDRLSLSSIHPEVWDATKADEKLLGKADVVIADLPCSGLGVINRKPDIRYRVTPEELQELQTLQREILTASIPYLKKGGYLVYSTCTMNPGENIENRDWIRLRYPDLTLMQDKQMLISGAWDGFYVAVFKNN